MAHPGRPRVPPNVGMEDAGNDGEQAIGKHVYAEGPGLSPTTSARAHVTNHYVGEAPDAVVNERTLLLVHINVV